MLVSAQRRQLALHAGICCLPSALCVVLFCLVINNSNRIVECQASWWTAGASHHSSFWIDNAMSAGTGIMDIFELLK